MLTIQVPDGEFYDESKEEFIQVKSRSLRLEHSLVSISKWESKWKKPFLNKQEKTNAEIIDYIKCMTLDQNVDPLVYMCITEKNLNEVNAYIDDPMTATWFNSKDNKKLVQREVITSEIIYYWMIALSIPQEYRKWHLNRLLTLINVCNIKNQKPQKMPRSEAMAMHRATNAARRKQYGSRGKV